MTREQIRNYLEFYRDLGIQSIYSRPAAPEPQAPKSTSTPVPLIALPSLAPERDTLEKILADIGDCKRCRLCEGRHNIVFGSGNEHVGTRVRWRRSGCGGRRTGIAVRWPRWSIANSDDRQYRHEGRHTDPAPGRLYLQCSEVPAAR